MIGKVMNDAFVATTRETTEHEGLMQKLSEILQRVQAVEENTQAILEAASKWPPKVEMFGPGGGMWTTEHYSPLGGAGGNGDPR